MFPPQSILHRGRKQHRALFASSLSRSRGRFPRDSLIEITRSGLGVAREKTNGGLSRFNGLPIRIAGTFEFEFDTSNLELTPKVRSWECSLYLIDTIYFIIFRTYSHRIRLIFFLWEKECRLKKERGRIAIRMTLEKSKVYGHLSWIYHFDDYELMNLMQRLWFPKAHRFKLCDTPFRKTRYVLHGRRQMIAFTVRIKVSRHIHRLRINKNVAKNCTAIYRKKKKRNNNTEHICCALRKRRPN